MAQESRQEAQDPSITKLGGFTWPADGSPQPHGARADALQAAAGEPEGLH